ncbi:MAG: cupin domain-containing protein [Burkholderiales bacterium]
MKASIVTTVAAIAVALGALDQPAARAQAHADHLMVVPAELKWSDVGSLPPGAKIAVIEGPLNEGKPFTMRLRFPASYQIPAHSHTAIEHVTVISGTFHMGMGNKLDTKATRALGPGSVAIMQAGARHFAWTREETEIQVHGVGPWTLTYVNPADDPRKKQ